MEFDFPHLYLSQTESTNKCAMELLSKTSPEPGFMIFADYQTAGKGQYGRNWESEPAKNLLCSFIFGPLALPVDRVFNLHLYSSLAIIHTLLPLKLPALKIKWPNDIYCGSKKICGILIQNTIKEQEVQYCIVGIGINVNQTHFGNAPKAGSLKLITKSELNRADLAIRLRTQLLNYFKGHFDDRLLLKEYNTLLYGLKQKFEFKSEGDYWKAYIHSVDHLGNIVLESEKGVLKNYTFGSLQFSSDQT